MHLSPALRRTVSCSLYDGDENIADLIQRRHCRIQTYGHKKDSAWRLGGVCVDSPWTMFEVFRQGEPYATFRTRLCGEHNLLNALADIALADQLNIPKEVIASALTSFQGVKRRQEIRGQKRQITVMDDFAHHPTAVRETIRAVASFYPKNRLIAVFEPRTNTSMRKVFQHEYPRSFDPADLICIRKPPLLEKIPAGERFSSEQLVEDLQRRGKSAYYFAETEAIIDFLLANALPGDLILIMSNGGFDNIHQRLLDRL
jgi:UDP-N-acetylmuramate: L-alanyl-gamma-D-glutamyl-meso-diaminopimelate ligase